MSGLLAQLDEWGEAFPDDGTLAQTVFAAVHDIVGALGGPFDVTLSTCVMSQLMVPFQTAWTASEETWGKLAAATSAVHLAVLARSTAAGGDSILVFDVLSSDYAPELTALYDRPSDELQGAIDSGVQSGAIPLQPDPETLVGQIAGSGLASMLRDPRLTGPWLWNTGRGHAARLRSDLPRALKPRLCLRTGRGPPDRIDARQRRLTTPE